MVGVRDWYTGAVLQQWPWAGLAGADLRGASLRYADMRKVDLRETDLRQADLRGALLWGADLRGANLVGALLRTCENAANHGLPTDLTGPSLWQAVYDPKTQWPHGFLPRSLGAMPMDEAAAREERPISRTSRPRTFVVGDVHGHSQKLRRLLEQFRKIAVAGEALVFLGDLIDRGPDTREVIELVLTQQEGEWPGPVIALRGNHEAMLLYCLDGHPEFTRGGWFNYGGIETLDSYGGEEWTLEDWMDLLPADHVAFLRDLKLWHQDENGIYVHAGLCPGRAPEEAGEGTLLWIREAFFNSDYRWDKVVVFGHTPLHEPPEGDAARGSWRPMNRPEKIGIDTGAAHGGPLTAVILPEREFIRVQ